PSSTRPRRRPTRPSRSAGAERVTEYAQFSREELLQKIARTRTLEGDTLSGVDLREGRFAELAIQESRLLNTDVAFADLTGATVLHTRFSDKRLGNASLIRADLRRAFLMDVDLRDANLKDAQLEGAVLVNVDLTGANLAGANLRNASLINVKTYMANFDHAN